MMPPMRLEALNRLPDARPVFLEGLASAIEPAPRLSVAELAEQKRIVSAQSGSRYPGPWRNERTPHLVGIMEALGPEDPAEDIVVVASAQVGKSETAINWFLHIVDQDPGPMMIVLPSIDESGKFVRTKLQPAIDETPALRVRVLDETSRSEKGSTASFKRFRGGFAQITFAGSSKGLQMLSARYTIADEVSEWPAEAGERGDPVAQLKKRTETYERDRKRLWVSTPSILGACRVSEMFAVSDQCRRYIPCPHCGTYQVLTFDRLKWESETWPHRAWFACRANGCVIEHVDKGPMLQAGVWIPTAGEDGPGLEFPADELEDWQSRPQSTRSRGFHIWKAYSVFTSWDSIVAEWFEAKDNPERLRVFTQQVLGEAWEDRGDAPDAEKLFACRISAIAKEKPPVGPVVFTGATDVQGNRLEWAVWGWSEGMTRWLVDWGVIEGDPTDLATWAAHDEMMMSRRYAPGGYGNPVAPDAWAVDSGYSSQMVYNYSRGRAGVFAIDGRDGRTAPFIGTPRKVDVKWNGKRVPKGATIWPVGTFALKSDLYGSIRKALMGPEQDTGALRSGAMVLSGEIDLAYAEQLTSEYLKQVETRSGIVTHRWEKLQGRPNEALDLACYARAMAHHLRLDGLKPEQWEHLRQERFGEAPQADDTQGDLFEVKIAPPVTVAPKETGPARRPRGVRGQVR
ncbi:terminase [Oceanicola sp. D3]|uniref:phage terminase large subunit family protein n=1 Tax=Oceanicola sp. D3 TaxID=2587163 RepID=UPI00111F1C00|nr:terminase gpA endonuclease subunit [Oceanicola sp. D3]QDC11268.1 terminase [Oceanicola sp. D3]